MTKEGRARPFGLTDGDRVRRIRDAFRSAGYTDGGVAQLLGDDVPPRLRAARSFPRKGLVAQQLPWSR